MWISGQNQPSGAESIEMHVPLTPKYVSRAVRDANSYSFGLHQNLIKTSDHNDKLRVVKQRSDFVSFAKLLVTCWYLFIR